MTQHNERPERPANQKTDVVTRFRDSYADTLHEAYVSMEHTATAGWQKLYGEHRTKMREKCRELSNDLRRIADGLEIRTPDEDVEKDLGDAKKTAASLNEDDAAFQTQVIDAVKRSVDECERVIDEAPAEAERDESRAPLMNVGLAELMNHAISAVERVVWDQESGRVLVKAR